MSAAWVGEPVGKGPGAHPEGRLRLSGCEGSVLSTHLSFLFPSGQIRKPRAAERKSHPPLWISITSPISPNFSASDLNLAKKMTIKEREKCQSP